MKYFKDLFERLKNGDGIVCTDSEDIENPEELKEYMFAILKSNMQYDFCCDFDDKDVVNFARAVVSDQIPKQ